jgi:hypothetical protein
MNKILTIICFLVIGALMFQFSYLKSTTTEIVLFHDVTEEYISKPDADEILSLFDLSAENKWNGFLFRYCTLSDVSYNRISETKIDPENMLLSNEIERDKKLKKFKAGVAEIIATNDTIGKSHSSLYLPLARQLNKLSQSKSDKRIVIIYSDLMENDPSISFYDKKKFALFESDPDSLEKLFDELQPLQSLSGIEVYIVYRPSDVAKDAEFRVVSEFYKKMLEQKGAQVTISANLVN